MPDRTGSYKTVFTVGFILLIFSCSEKTVMRKRVRNTIAASGYSTDTACMRNAMKSELAIYDLKPNEVVGEIGFGSGWLTGFILYYYDSLTYYANDIDKASLKAIEPVTEKYLTLRKKPNTNKLLVIEGTDTRTNLPANTFDKLILRETFHHFDHPNEMLQDIRSLLRPTGKLFVYEPDVPETFYNKECGAKNFSKADLLQSFSFNGFEVVKEFELKDSPGNIPSWEAKDAGKSKPKKVFVLKSRS